MKKILTIVITLLLCINTTAFSYRDIHDSNLQNSVETLSSFKIINGYEDGTFRPDNNITRAEFAKIITIAMRIENIMPSGEELFNDISDDSWYKDYVYVAKTAGIINGTSDITFEPEENITYEQAIKMIAAALGYNEEAQARGGYPEGYLDIAKDLGITDNMYFENTAFATRGDIAMMTYKALHSKCYYLIFDGDKIERMEADNTLYELHKIAHDINSSLDNEVYEENLEADVIVTEDSVG